MKKLPKAIGPYSVYRKVGNMLYTSGQIPINPESNKVEATTIEEQTTQVLDNITSILSYENLTMENIVKTTVYLKNMNDFSNFNTIYAQYFKEPYPSRTAIEVSQLPLDVLVEIEIIACIDSI